MWIEVVSACSQITSHRLIYFEEIDYLTKYFGVIKITQTENLTQNSSKIRIMFTWLRRSVIPGLRKFRINYEVTDLTDTR
jgi:hypothetical protein